MMSIGALDGLIWTARDHGDKAKYYNAKDSPIGNPGLGTEPRVRRFKGKKSDFLQHRPNWELNPGPTCCGYGDW